VEAKVGSSAVLTDALNSYYGLFGLIFSPGGAMYFSFGLSTYLGRSSAIEALISFVETVIEGR
jgi:hypothetical protein